MAVRLVFLIVIYLALHLINTQDLVSPCPRVFIYEPKGREHDRWYGVATLVSQDPVDGIWLRVTFDNPALQLGNWFGEVRTDDNTSYLIKNRNHNLDPNSPYLLRFFVKYDVMKPIPKLISMRLNGKTICPEEVATTSPPITSDKVDTPVSIPPSISVPSVVVQQTTIQITNNCGRPEVDKPQSLILYGNNSSEGEWPWHTALFQNNGGTSRYICGGTLISDKFIITAAHCVADPFTGDNLGASKFLAYLGTATVKDFGTGLQIHRLSRIGIHPDYTSANYHNDIAILKTDKPVDFTFYVKPVCLWSGDTNLNLVVGQLGTVVGWGIDENNNPAENLKHVELPIVDSLQCIYSKPEFFSKYTSMTSFCAGYRNGSGACNGDSGSGLVVNQPDAKGQKTWFLRGLVSISVRHKERDACDPTHYFVFTDVAKYVTWISKTMDNI